MALKTCSHSPACGIFVKTEFRWVRSRLALVIVSLRLPHNFVVRNIHIGQVHLLTSFIGKEIGCADTIPKIRRMRRAGKVEFWRIVARAILRRIYVRSCTFSLRHKNKLMHKIFRAIIRIRWCLNKKAKKTVPFRIEVAGGLDYLHLKEHAWVSLSVRIIILEGLEILVLLFAIFISMLELKVISPALWGPRLVWSRGL